MMSAFKTFAFASIIALSVSSAALACEKCGDKKKECKPAAGHMHKHSHAHPHAGAWGYSGQNGPAFWGELDTANTACTQGRKQSPVNIAQFLKGDLPDIGFAYNDIPLAVTHTGHSAQVNVPPGSKATIEGKVYELVSIDFHTPSEHYMDGAPYPMEAHLFHKDDKGHWAVIAVMMKVGGENATAGQIWSHIPDQPGREEAGEAGAAISAYDLLPAATGYYTYEGSLTAPPCTEGVKWLIMQQPIEISQEQLGVFQSSFPHNARPLQSLNGRTVLGD